MINLEYDFNKDVEDQYTPSEKEKSLADPDFDIGVEEKYIQSEKEKSSDDQDRSVGTYISKKMSNEFVQQQEGGKTKVAPKHVSNKRIAQIKQKKSDQQRPRYSKRALKRAGFSKKSMSGKSAYKYAKN